MKLQQFRNGGLKIDIDDQLFLQRFERLFSSIHNGRNVIHISPGFRTTFKDEVSAALEHLKKLPGNKVFLCINPDTDIPSPKKEFFLQDDIPYTDQLQRSLEESKLEDLVDIEILKEFDEHIQSFCHAVTRKAPGLHMIPIGRDWKGLGVLLDLNFDIGHNRSHLCYYNCSMPPLSIHWYGRIREHIAKSCLTKDFIKTSNLEVYRKRELNYHTFANYYSDIINSEFMMCPRGCGADTYRMWDCLYLGCIPIVVKYEGYEEFEDLPILFIDKWQDYQDITQEFLLKAKEEMLDKDFNYEKLKFSWWESRIRKEVEKSLSF